MEGEKTVKVELAEHEYYKLLDCLDFMVSASAVLTPGATYYTFYLLKKKFESLPLPWLADEDEEYASPCGL